LLALLGARANEIAALRWSEVCGDTIVLAADRVKNKRGHEIPLTAVARQIIEAQPRRTNAAGVPRDLIFGQGEGGFTGWSKSKARLDTRVAEATGKPLPQWTPHDLRRSFSTHANELGLAPPHIVEAALGHISGFRPGIQKHYNLAQYRAEKAKLLQRWSECLLNWVEGRESNIVTLRQA
jgi:integrase